uniref:Uncharacterized protein n=1 Tax=Arundo donax TaxID=35708 RepID=A0A0A9AQ17_ARUDO
MLVCQINRLYHPVRPGFSTSFGRAFA